ncbi:MAG: hypothetical protein IJT94_11390 [Oscillibacter sp.]|nr:hypothetical protein [Oscillibacter sp.]
MIRFWDFIFRSIITSVILGLSSLILGIFFSGVLFRILLILGFIVVYVSIPQLSAWLLERLVLKNPSWIEDILTILASNAVRDTFSFTVDPNLSPDDIMYPSRNGNKK